MGHKAHPLALRLASGTRRQDTHLYSKRHRDTVFLQHMALETYLHRIGDSMGSPRPRVAYQSSHRGIYVYPFYCTTEDQRALGSQCRVSEGRQHPPVGPGSPWAYTQPMPWTFLVSMPRVYPSVDSLSPAHLVEWAMTLHGESCARDAMHQDMCFSLQQGDKGNTPSPLRVQGRDMWLHQHIVNRMEQAYSTPVHYIPLRVHSMWKHAGYLADAIVWCMERRVRFTTVKRLCTHSVQRIPDILGVRIACAGRVGGRSKKSQRARRDIWKYGATPLHVYSREIEYAQRTAHTPLGSMGVSVWLYRRPCSTRG
jgi:hypothetical protein